MVSTEIVPPPPGAEAAALSRAVNAALADPAVRRLIVRPPAGYADPDLFLSQVVGVLMRHERLDIEVAYVAPTATPATKVYSLPHGEGAAVLAETGVAQELPLIRDDAATVLVGRARHVGLTGTSPVQVTALHGETYVDSARLFDGDVRAVVIEPLPQAPGVRARLDRRFRFGGWLTGRAVQTGGTNLAVEREGVLTPRVLKRSTFYRHHLDWKLVRP
ncbi:hypothetical protein GOHSU_41_00040 [Gordonia hirsuta DSM 44140 = NBRC 16056]|uniref:Uncharacterized protein n=1 Tax=Gordonia hirsuta DSM 44140 = NBRC 16056 TaxID=1121927 RepID=L7LEI3_9ACTN|nr:hypothetical protein [Gordonia hirsuta]GAC58467.1 hypothetical protein GOHSU_41_00040 [Gordonia hirsuta DSM 44140 = NBRC 16056]